MPYGLPIPPHLYGKRLDYILSTVFKVSRQKIKNVFFQHPDNIIIYNQTDPCTIRTASADTKVKQGDQVTLSESCIESIVEPPHIEDTAENIPLSIIEEDPDFFIINKPAGIVMHPGAGCRNGTILNALLYHYPEQEKVHRAGIVHRLDKDTSGLFMVARTPESYASLTKQLEQRTVSRTYIALSHGEVRSQIIEKPIGRDPHHRTRMCVHPKGRYAKTIIQRECFYDEHNVSKIHCTLCTGRTHQIRVHLQSIGHPLLGDQTYHSSQKMRDRSSDMHKVLGNLNRQALHAHLLSLKHPRTDQLCHFSSPLPTDIAYIINYLHCLQI